MKKVLILGLGLALGGCQVAQIQDSHTKFVALEAATATSETVALAYVTLPPCPQAKLCSDLTTVKRIASAKLYLDAAVAGARTAFANGESDAKLQQALALVQGALATLDQLNSTLPKGN